MIYAAAPSFAPATEDALLLDFFGTLSDGYFVDIGAHDGRSYSNTRPLWERGWSGMLIEPDPDTFKLLQANYPSKERLEFRNVAICQKNGPISFTKHRDPDRTGWHSIAPDWIATFAPGKAYRITVPGVRFDSLVFPRAIDFLSIDTEGYDADILESMPESIRPRLIMCEVDKNGVRPRIEAEMARRRYEFIWGTYLNSAYRARSAMSKRVTRTRRESCLEISGWPYIIRDPATIEQMLSQNPELKKDLRFRTVTETEWLLEPPLEGR